jgi:hypothetical protein
MDSRTVLQELEGNLNEDVSRQIRGEVSNLLNSTIAVTGAEFRCNADFLRERVIQSLKSLKGQVKQVLNGKQYEQELAPYICNTVPESVDLDVPASRREVKYYGFDMIEDNVTAFAIVDNGTEINLSQYLSFGTRYKMSLDLSRVSITSSWLQIVIKRNESRLSSIPILANAPVNCEEQRHVQQMTEYTFIPRHTSGGDRDFGGNGPSVNCVVEYLVNANSIDVKVYMKARETKSNWTTAEQTETFNVVRVAPGRKITRIEGNTRSQRSYTDHNHSEDKFNETGQQPVNRFIFMGDTGGDESGTKTRVTLEFNRLVYYTKDASCN